MRYMGDDGADPDIFEGHEKRIAELENENVELKAERDALSETISKSYTLEFVTKIESRHMASIYKLQSHYLSRIERAESDRDVLLHAAKHSKWAMKEVMKTAAPFVDATWMQSGYDKLRQAIDRVTGEKFEAHNPETCIECIDVNEAK